MEEASAILGANRIQTFKVIFPEIMPAALTGFALAFARAIGEYGSVVFIAGNMPMKTEITPLIIMTKLEQYDYVLQQRLERSCSLFHSSYFCSLTDCNGGQSANGFSGSRRVLCECWHHHKGGVLMAGTNPVIM